MIEDTIAALGLGNIDLILLGAIVFSGCYGLFRGFVKESLSMVVWLVAIVLAFRFPHLVSPYLEPWVTNSLIRLVFSGIVVGVAAVVIGNTVVNIASFFINKFGLSSTDRLLGLLFGTARGVVVLLLLLSFLRPALGDMGWWKNSKLIAEMAPYEVLAAGFFNESVETYKGHLGVFDEFGEDE